MGEDLVLRVDSLQGSEAPRSSGESSCSHSVDSPALVVDIKEEAGCNEDGESDPLLHASECRICQEEDSVKNLEAPCACSGSLKFAHRKCVQRWCNEKGDTTCEICHEPYQPGYTAPPRPPEDVTIDISGAWRIGDGPLDLHDPRILAMAAAERRLMETEYDDYDDSSASGAAFCRSAALILIALLLLRHALTIGNGDGDDDDDISTFFSLFLLRVAGFLLPCYILAWAISMMHRRRQRQEAAALAATEVAYMLHAAHMHVTVAGPSPGPAPTTAPAATTQEQPSATPHPEPVQ